MFVLFGVGALFISLTVFPLLRLSTRDRDVARRRIQHGMQHTFRLYMEIMRVLGILTYEVEGVERLREPGRLIVANHPTLLDVVLLVSLMPEVDCIVKRGLWRNPFLRWPVSWAAYIPNSEGEELVEGCAATLAARPFAAGISGRDAHRARKADAHAAWCGAHCARRGCGDPAGDDDLRSADAVQGQSVVSRAGAALPHEGGRRRAGCRREFRHDGESPARSARRLTQWLLAYYGATAGERTVRDAQAVKSCRQRRVPMASAMS